MKLPHVNCVRCLQRIEGPFDLDGDGPPETCPHCGQKAYYEPGDTDRVAPPVGMSAIKIGELDGMTPEEAVKRMLELLRELAGGDAGHLDLVEQVERQYERAKQTLPKPYAELAVLAACQEALWEVQRRHAPPGSNKKHLLNWL